MVWRCYRDAGACSVGCVDGLGDWPGRRIRPASRAGRNGPGFRWPVFDPRGNRGRPRRSPGAHELRPAAATARQRTVDGWCRDSGALLSVPAVKNRLKVLRAERNWSQQELGMRVGVSRQAINAVETGKFDPSLPLALKLAHVFDTTVEAVFELEAGD